MAAAGGMLNGAVALKKYEANKNYLGDLERSYNEDAKYQRVVGDRKLQLLSRTQSQQYDRMVSQLAQSGISFSGSAVDVLTDSKVEQFRERNAVEFDTEMRVNDSYNKAASARSQANDLHDNLPLTLAGSFLGGAAMGYGRG